MTDLRRHVPPVTLVWDDEVPGALSRVVDGTLVFADVSGFTALTERLSRRGRIGAEEIVETLNRVFGPMLRIAATARRRAAEVRRRRAALPLPRRGPPRAGLRRRRRDAGGAARGRRGADLGGPPLPLDVGRRALGRRRALPRRLAHPRAPRPRPGRLGHRPGGEGGERRRGRRQSRPPRPASRPGPRGRATDGELLLRRRAAHSPPGPPAPVPPGGEALLHDAVPGRARRLPRSRAARPRAPRRHDRVRPLLGHGRHPRGAGARGARPTRCTSLVTGGRGRPSTPRASRCSPPTSTPTAASSSSARACRCTQRGRRGPDAARAAPHRGCRPAPPAAAGREPRPRLRRRGGHRRASRLLRHGRHDEHGGPDHGDRPGRGRSTRTPTVLEHSRTRFAVTPAGPFAMKGKAVPMSVYAVGEETGHPRGPRRVAAALPRPRRGGGDGAPGPRGGAGRQPGASSPSTAPRAWASPASPTRRSTRWRRRPARGGSSCAPSPTARRAPTGCCATPSARCSASRATRPTSWVRRSSPTLERCAPDLLPMAPLLADVVQVDVPDTPEADRIDPQYRADRAADVVIDLLGRARAGSARPRRRGGPLGRRRVGPPPRPGRLRHGGPAVGGARRAPRRDGWLRPGVRARRRPRPAAARGHRAARPSQPPRRPPCARTRSPPSSSAPRATRSSSRRSPASPLGSGSLGAASRVRPRRDEHPDRPARPRQCGASCATARCSAAASGARSSSAPWRPTASPSGPTTLSALASFIEDDGEDRLRFRNSLVRDAAYEGLAFRVRARIHRTAGEVLEGVSTDLDADSPTLGAALRASR